MTTFCYTIDLDDSEAIALQAALDHYAAECEQNIANDVRAPFWAHRESIRKIRKRLPLKTQQMSAHAQGRVILFGR